MLTEATNPRSAALLKAIIYWIIFMLLLFVTGIFIVRMFPASWERFVYGISGTIGSCIAVWVLLKSEKRSFADYGLTWQKNTVVHFIKGLFIGAASFGLIIVILLLFTELKISKNTTAWDPLMLFWYLAIIPLALMEEVAFRSYSFLKLNTAFGLRVTQLIIAIVFALYHIVQGWNWQIAFLGPGIWALVFGL
ncbi:MAG: type II CAAX prenyl endopeptidase Rce1 family protein, partial [Ferruginibacter sp.]